jgi:hypothetical protein
LCKCSGVKKPVKPAFGGVLPVPDVSLDEMTVKKGTKCAACNLEITSRSVNALGGDYHIDCFKCDSCKLPLLGSGSGKVTFQVRGTKPWCEACCAAKPIASTIVGGAKFGAPPVGAAGSDFVPTTFVGAKKK